MGVSTAASDAAAEKGELGRAWIDAQEKGPAPFWHMPNLFLAPVNVKHAVGGGATPPPPVVVVAFQ